MRRPITLCALLPVVLLASAAHPATSEFSDRALELASAYRVVPDVTLSGRRRPRVEARCHCAARGIPTASGPSSTSMAVVG